uniref:Reverse transcriptase domain-containing protein n=1 Tax=Aegilops tauschii subsp. strangulata TaxID=200361 RepID=A0A453LNM5_AEGTS
DANTAFFHKQCSYHGQKNHIEHLIEPCDLAGLDEPFNPEKIWSAIKLLPARKAPGPDGFTAEFVRACWGTI